MTFAGKIAILVCLVGVMLADSRGRSVGAQSSAAMPTSAPFELRADLNKGTWARGPDLPSARQDAAVAVLAGRIYLIGGYGPHNEQMDTTLVWEPEIAQEEPGETVERAGVRLGAWTYAAPIPEPVDHAAAAAVGGYIYVAGGRIENLVTNKFWRYDVADDSWVEFPSMPIPRYGATMQAFEDKLYLVGGAVSHGNDATSMEVFDTTTNQWSIKPYALEDERDGLESSVLADHIIILGGRDPQERNLSACEAYDPYAQRWQGCSYLHEPRSDFGLSTVNGRLVAVGGDNLQIDHPTQTMEISEPYIDGWLDGPWLPSPRHGMAQVTLGNVVWVIGGASSSGTAPTAAVMRYVSPVIKIEFKGRA
jgi:Kelch motif